MKSSKRKPWEQRPSLCWCYWCFNKPSFLSIGYRGVGDFPGDSAVKNPPAMQETRVWSLGQEETWRRAWQPLQYSCLENPHGQRSLAGYSPYVVSLQRVRHNWSDWACIHRDVDAGSICIISSPTFSSTISFQQPVHNKERGIMIHLWSTYSIMEIFSGHSWASNT